MTTKAKAYAKADLARMAQENDNGMCHLWVNRPNNSTKGGKFHVGFNRNVAAGAFANYTHARALSSIGPGMSQVRYELGGEDRAGHPGWVRITRSVPKGKLKGTPSGHINTSHAGLFEPFNSVPGSWKRVRDVLTVDFAPYAHLLRLRGTASTKPVAPVRMDEDEEEDEVEDYAEKVPNSALSHALNAIDLKADGCLDELHQWCEANELRLVEIEDLIKIQKRARLTDRTLTDIIGEE